MKWGGVVGLEPHTFERLRRRRGLRRKGGTSYCWLTLSPGASRRCLPRIWCARLLLDGTNRCPEGETTSLRW